MSFTYDLSTDTGKVRAVIPDRTAATAVFSDEEIAVFLAMEGGVFRAAALALETAGADTVLTQGVVRSLDVDLDGAAASRELRQRAVRLREQADAADARSGALFDIAEWVAPGDDFAARERIDAELLRSGS